MDCAIKKLKKQEDYVHDLDYLHDLECQDSGQESLSLPNDFDPNSFPAYLDPEVLWKADLDYESSSYEIREDYDKSSSSSGKKAGRMKLFPETISLLDFSLIMHGKHKKKASIPDFNPGMGAYLDPELL